MKNHQIESITGGEILCQLLACHNVEHVFGYPGGAALPLFDGIYKTELFEFILSHHEQGAGHMAEGYACASRKPGVVMVTSGPGSSNLVTPMLDALLDGTPMVVICGQVATNVQGTGAFQEINIMAIAKHCTKWSAQVEHVGDMPRIISEAFYHATSHRAGPVLVAIPMDVGKAVFEELPLEVFSEIHTKVDDDHDEIEVEKNEHKTLAAPRSDGISTTEEDLAHIAKLINNSQRPVICAGHGVLASEIGHAVLSQIARKSNIPVATTLLGLGCFDETLELALHMVGTYGAPYANYAIQNADLILVFGARLDERAVATPDRYAPKAKEAAEAGRGGIFQFDIDPNTVGKVVKPTQVILGDLSQTLSSLLPLLNEEKVRTEWLNQIQQWKTQYAFQAHRANPQSHPFPQQVLAELDAQTALCKNRTILTTGVGQHQMWTAQRYRFRHPHSLITSGSLGTMGFGLPAAIGAQLARPYHTVIDIDGDASFCMTMEELLTAAQHNIPIKVVIFNNSSQGMIQQLQRSDYGGRVCHAQQVNPDFVQLAHSMGCEGRRCESAEDLARSVQWLLECRAPALLDVPISDTEMRPIVLKGEALDHMELE